ncbi:hypothetical protein INT45_003501 [Circinella minor]|uniref:SH3 domain-containing protein n=1 Tax=Circinella minor TaxID=1195481 RepID=A0A8H7VLY1_9FUNG|nr:hypothetical protein INT45_003501 [Circinella minor]
MPPNSATTVDSYPSMLSLEDHFWACDKQGMDKLVSTIKNSYKSLDDILELYNQRALLEREYGQKLMGLNKLKPDDDDVDDVDRKTTHTPLTNEAVKVVYQEVNKSAQSHIDMANRLEQEVAIPLKEWISTHRHDLNTLVDSLNTIYDDRQEKLKQLLFVRDQYQVQNGKRSSSISNYQHIVDAADKSVQEWNIAWKKACQDEWSENIRSQLESCTIEEELAHCIEKYSTGSTTAPTTSDYVEFFAKTFKRESMFNKRLPPRPRTMSSTAATITNKPNEIANCSSINNNNNSHKYSSMGVSRKPVATNDAGLDALLKKFESTTLAKNHNNSSETSRSSNNIVQKKRDNNGHSPVDSTIKPNDSHYPLVQNQLPTDTQQKRPSSVVPPHSVTHRKQEQTKKRESRPPLEPIQTQQHRSEKQVLAQQPLPPPQQPPKSPRPQARPAPQMNPSVSSSTDINNSNNIDNVLRQPPRSPIMPSPQMAPACAMNIPHSTAPAMSSSAPSQPLSALPTQQYQPQQSNMMPLQPPTSPMMMASSAPHSPIMTPLQNSPALQPISSPMMPPTSPGLGHTPQPYSSYPVPTSPMIPPHSPIIPTLNNNNAAWAASANSNSYNNYYNQSPLMSATPRPSTTYADDQQMLPDGRPIMFWVRAKYDYLMNENTEISFKRGSLLAVIGMSQDDGWWNAVKWDEAWHRPREQGCIPSNYVEVLR